MDKNVLNIKVESKEHNFIIEEKPISKIYIAFPFLRSAISGNLFQLQGELCLHLYDQIASSCVGNIEYMSYFYSPNLFTKTIHIFVPNHSIHNIDIHLENGNLFLQRIHAQTVNIFNIKGNIKIKDSKIISSMLRGFESNISAVNLRGNDCSISTGTGNLKLEGLIPNKNYLETLTGDISLLLKDQNLDYTQLDIESKSLKCSLEPRKSLKKTIKCFDPYGDVSSDFL